MGAQRSQPETHKHIVTSQNHRFKAIAAGMCGWRLSMEDAHICQTDIGDGNSLFAVFDGHGGSQVAEFVSKKFVGILLKDQNYVKKLYEKALSQTYMNIDRILKTPQGEAEALKCRTQHQPGKNIAHNQKLESGCTAVVCLVTQNQIFVANAGDSRCFLGIGKKSEDMSVDHKPDLPAQAERIKKAGGEVMYGRVNGNLNLSRAIGDLQYKKNQKVPEDEQLIICKPEIMKRQLKGVEHIVLGCDGIFQVKSNQEIYNLILQRSSDSLEENVKQILQILLSKNNQDPHGHDNMSMIIVKVK